MIRFAPFDFKTSRRSQSHRASPRSPSGPGIKISHPYRMGRVERENDFFHFFGSKSQNCGHRSFRFLTSLIQQLPAQLDKMQALGKSDPLEAKEPYIRPSSVPRKPRFSNRAIAAAMPAKSPRCSQKSPLGCIASRLRAIQDHRKSPGLEERRSRSSASSNVSRAIGNAS